MSYLSVDIDLDDIIEDIDTSDLIAELYSRKKRDKLSQENIRLLRSLVSPKPGETIKVKNLLDSMRIEFVSEIWDKIDPINRTIIH